MDLQGEENNSSKAGTSTPDVCTKSTQSLSHSRGLEEESDTVLSTQNKEMSSISEELENKIDINSQHQQSEQINRLFLFKHYFQFKSKCFARH